MITNNSRMSNLDSYCKEFGCSQRDGLMDLLFMFYEAAGFCPDILENEIHSMSDEKLLEAYLNL